VSDIQKTLLGLDRGDAALRQYIRDEGKMVRRRFELPAESSTTTEVFRAGAIPYRFYSDTLTSGVFDPGGTVYRTRVTGTRRWFSGAFTYHLPYDDSLRKKMSADAVRARGVLNLSLTPETLWNIAPWSWAVDWILPVGDLISNLQDHSSDGLVLKYGYVMEHSYATDTYTYVGPGSAHCGVISLTSETKQRHKASPFGFGIDWNGLSPFQLSIAAALGISRR
jgi:hypothetical protein